MAHTDKVCTHRNICALLISGVRVAALLLNAVQQQRVLFRVLQQLIATLRFHTTAVHQDHMLDILQVL